MKFTLLDSQVSQSSSSRDKHLVKHDDTYQYLDDLLDKTFLFDYFLVHRRDGDNNDYNADSATTSPLSNK